MKIIVTSDLHGNLPSIPEGDVLLICGDIVPLSIQSNVHKTKRWITNQFLDWCESLPVNKIIFIAGNHDWQPYWDDGIFLHSIFTKENRITYLQDELIEYKGIKIYGTPWCKIFYNWAFMLNDEGLSKKYNTIPKGLDILMTHDAPIQNQCGIIHEGINTGENASNSVLSNVIREKQPKYAVCGHIHSGNHTLTEIGETKFANCSYVNEEYNPIFKPLIIEL